MSSPYKKLHALADLIHNALSVHDTSYKVARTPKAEVVLTGGYGRDARKRIMGDPVKYFEVLYQSEGAESSDAFLHDLQQERVRHTFSVDGFKEYLDDDQAEDSSYWAWMELLETPTTGVLEVLRETTALNGLYLIDDTGQYIRAGTQADGAGGAMTTGSGTAMKTGSGSAMKTGTGTDSGLADNRVQTDESYIGHLGHPSNDALANAILPLGDGVERAHVTAFTIEITH